LAFIIGPLGCIVNKFLVIVHQHFYLALFSEDHHGLITHATDHVKWIPRLSAKGQLQGVFFNAVFQGFFQGRVDLKKPVCRTQPADALVGPSVIVIFNPKSDPAGGILVTGKLGAL
jgi:hypothetical protein